MRLRRFDRSEVASFVAVAWPLLAADPVRHTDGLTVLDALFRPPDRVRGRERDRRPC